jgi:phosphoribosylaminoimidazole-succinocarboxamide synthase
LSALQQIPESNRKGEKYEAVLKSCNLAVELLKAQLQAAALNQKHADVKKEISSVQDSIITFQDGIVTAD